MTQVGTEPVARPATPAPGGAEGHVSGGAQRLLTMSTLALTLVFAGWLLFDIPGVPVQKELGLTGPSSTFVVLFLLTARVRRRGRGHQLTHGRPATRPKETSS